MLTLRHTGLSSPAYRDWEDYVIVEDSRDVRSNYPTDRGAIFQTEFAETR